MKLKLPLDLKSVGSFEDLRRFTSLCIKEIVDLVNGSIDVVDNLSVSLVSVTFSGASTTVEVSHTLGRVPRGYLVAKLSTGIVVFDGNGTNTDALFYVQATGAGTATLLVF